MWKLGSFIFVLSLSFSAISQTWQWTEMSPMPFQTANNAVCEAFVGNSEFMYSFGGIDTSKVYTGIHNRCFRYDVANDAWSEIDSLPDPEPKIAAAASFVKGKIYIIGGYHVYQNGSETSSELVHIYNPATNSFEANGAPIPTAIDDQVQCVYKDSLIFVVTGWSNTTNVPNVQIYDPSLDQWQAGTSTVNTSYFKAFGASGEIIGDTLYYHGGAAGMTFAARSFMRKGYINPNDPTDITWELMEDAPGNAGYRSACSSEGNTVFWVGGSPTSYNYNGIAYNGSGGVNPSARVLHFNNSTYGYSDEVAQPYGVMDLRGIAKLGNGRWMICGGMDTNQVVSNRTFLLESATVGSQKLDEEMFNVRDFDDYLIVETPIETRAKLTDATGRIVREFGPERSFKIERSIYPSGVYIFSSGTTSVRIYM